ncbi:hypothetical protein T439DRAFT_276336, partial [Meredithblackwellia eburnea MCA 4105]
YYLPTAVIESYTLHDGQDPFASCQEGLVFGLRWLPIDEVEQEWNFWRAFEQAGGRGAGDEFASGMSSFPPGWVRSRYSHPGWLPLLTDRAGNYIGVDLDPPPPPPASPGQVIAFGREIDEKVVLFPGDSSGGWGRFLAAFVDDLSRGE